MEKPLFLAEKPSPNLLPHRFFRFDAKHKFMIFDFSHTCKTYDKDFYSKPHFVNTRCPKCPAIGRFNLHGSYSRHVLYLEKYELVYKLIEIRRVKCQSCKTTHAVMPGDLIPYRLLSLYAVIFILVSFYIGKKPVLRLAGKLNFSFQFIYSVLGAFLMHVNSIHQHFRETVPESVPSAPWPEETLALIRKPYLGFQSGYLLSNRRPCFMCKFFNKGGAPPIGDSAPNCPLGGNNITIE